MSFVKGFKRIGRFNRHKYSYMKEFEVLQRVKNYMYKRQLFITLWHSFCAFGKIILPI